MQGYLKSEARSSIIRSDVPTREADGRRYHLVSSEPVMLGDAPGAHGEESCLGPRDRNPAVDAMRLIAVLCVICVHTEPFSPDRLAGHSFGWHYMFIGISTASRFAVPFFFCISGYFWGTKIRRGSSPTEVSLAMCKRISVVFAVWSVIYFLGNHLLSFVSDVFPKFPRQETSINLSVWRPMALILQGTALHLWYLPALLCAVIISWLFVIFRWHKYLLAGSIVMFVFATLARPYSETALGVSMQAYNFRFDTRNGPFFSTIFFVTGYLLSAHIPRPRWVGLGCLLLSAGFLLHITEIRIIHSLLHAPPLTISRQDFVFGTYAMGLGATMIALSRPSWLSNVKLARWGRLTLGTYCVHGFFAHQWLLRRLESPVAEILFPIAVLLLSLATANLLSRARVTRFLVQ